MPTKIILAGEGGQGVQVVAKIIALAAQKANKFSSYLASFGTEQRGGVSLAFVQISPQPISYPRFEKANIVVAFSNRSITTIKKFISENSLFVYDNSAIENSYLEKIKSDVKNYLAIPAQKLGREKFSKMTSNMILLGALTAHIKEIGFGEFENAILEEFAEKILKKPEIKDLNLGALKAGLELAEKFDASMQPFEGITPVPIKTTYSKENISWTRFPEYCKGCGLCLLKCPQKAIRFSKDIGFLGNPLPEVDLEKCIGCGKCQEICPEGAIRVEKN